MNVMYYAMYTMGGSGPFLRSGLPDEEDDDDDDYDDDDYENPD